MIQYLIEQFKRYRLFQIIVILFVLFSVWWFSIFSRGLTNGIENKAFSATYCIFALLGGVGSWILAMKWGGFKSIFGRSLAVFSLGLLAQFVGQVMYSYDILVRNINAPYPSWGDLAYFVSVLLYIIGIILLSKVISLRLSLKSVWGKVLSFLIPFAILFVYYIVFLRGYEPDLSNKIRLFLDFGYPIGQAVYISVATLTLLISKNMLGGLMRKPIMLLLVGLIFQYFADFVFSYQFSRNTWYAGGFDEYLYLVSYFFMAISLIAIGNMFYKIKQS